MNLWFLNKSHKKLLIYVYIKKIKCNKWPALYRQYIFKVNKLLNGYRCNATYLLRFKTIVHQVLSHVQNILVYLKFTKIYYILILSGESIAFYRTLY